MKHLWIMLCKPYSCPLSFRLLPWHTRVQRSQLQQVLRRNHWHLTEIQAGEWGEGTAQLLLSICLQTLASQKFDLTSVRVSFTPLWRTLQLYSPMTRSVKRQHLGRKIGWREFKETGAFPRRRLHLRVGHLFGGLRNRRVLNTYALRIWVVHLLVYSAPSLQVEHCLGFAGEHLTE